MRVKRSRGDSVLNQLEPVASSAMPDEGWTEAVPVPDTVGTVLIPPVPPPDGEIRGVLYGERTTFGSVPWWSDRDWWKLSPDGDGNDVRSHVGTFGDLALAATSVRGNKHRLQGSLNEDSFSTCTVTLEGGSAFLIAVVCDGMGSAPLSGFGARLAAQATARGLKRWMLDFPENFEDQLLAHQAALLDGITQAVLGFRADEFASPENHTTQPTFHDFQCTMSFAIVPASPGDNPRKAVMGFIGDSPSFLLRNRSLHAIEAAKDHEGLWSSAADGLLGATAFLMADVALWPGDGLLLSSDGFGNFLLYKSVPTALGADIAARWSQPVSMLSFIRDVSFETASADDDRTALMIWIDR